MNYDSENEKIETTVGAVGSALTLGSLDAQRKTAHIAKTAADVGVLSIFDDFGIDLKTPIENFIEKNKQETLKTEEKLNEWSSSKGMFGGTVFSLAGGIIRNTADPVNLAINSIMPGGLLVNFLENVVEYAFDEATLYDRNIVTDFDPEKDVVGIGMSAGVLALSQGMRMKADSIYSVPLGDISFKKYDNAGRVSETLKDEEMINLMKKNDLDVSERGKFYKDLGFVTETLDAIQKEKDPKNIKELWNTLKGYEEVIDFVKKENIDDKKEIPRMAPLDSLVSDIKSMNVDVEANLRDGGDIPMNAGIFQEVSKRQLFDQPQANYLSSTGMKSDIHNYVSSIAKMDREFKSKEYAGVERGKAVKGGSVLKIKDQADIYLQPLIKNTKLAISQLEAEDARELFQATKNNKPFGNQLYDLASELDPTRFVKAMQGVEELDVKNIVNSLREQGKNIQADKLEGSTNFQKIIKNKINEFIGVKSKQDKAPDIKKAYYLDTFYDKQNYAANLVNTIKKANQDEIDFFSKYIGKDIEVSEADVISIRNSLRSWGMESKIESNGVYSLSDFPQELLNLFWQDINATTKEALKKGGTWGEAQSYKEIAGKWGREAPNISKMDSLASTFDGFERKPYEIISNVYATVAKDKVGLDDLDLLRSSLKIDETKIKPEFTSPEANALKSLDGRVREIVRNQIDNLRLEGEVEKRYKPNLNIDPNTQKFSEGHLRNTVKGFFGWKFLANLNYLREIPANYLKNISGARKLGWDRKYSIYQAVLKDPVELHRDLAKAFGEIKNKNVSAIEDPIIRRKAEIFLEKRVANDPIFNNPENFSMISKALNSTEKTIQKAGALGGVGQSISDVHRVFGAEFGAMNYMKDIMPDIEYGKTPWLKDILESNNISKSEFLSMKYFLKKAGEADLQELFWGGKRADTDLGIKLQNIFEQFSQFMGKEMDFIEDPTSVAGKGGFAEDMMYLYKRYSLGMFNTMVRDVLNVYSDTGFLEKRFAWQGDVRNTMKRVFKGANAGSLVNFSLAAANTTLTMWGVSYITGKLTGTSSDEITESKLEALMAGDIAPIMLDGLFDFAMDKTGMGILFGGSTVLGGLQKNQIGRYKRAFSAENLSSVEALGYYLSTWVVPESIARGIDNVKFQKSIPSRITTSSDEASLLWRSEYKQKAMLEQLEGQLPIEKAIAYLNPINWMEYFDKNPDKAYDVLGAPKDHDKTSVIIGAAGLVGAIEEQTEMASINEIMSDSDLDNSQKEYRLKILGLDTDTQLKKLNKKERNTLGLMLSYKNISDKTEVLHILYQFNKTKDKKEFLYELIGEEQLEGYRTFQELYKENKEKIKKENKNRLYKTGIDAYMEVLDITKRVLRQ